MSTYQSLIAKLSSVPALAPKEKAAKKAANENAVKQYKMTFVFAKSLLNWIFSAFEESKRLTYNVYNKVDKGDGHEYTESVIDDKTAPKGSGLTRYFWLYDHQGKPSKNGDGGTLRLSLVPDEVKAAFLEDFGMSLEDAVKASHGEYTASKVATKTPAKTETAKPAEDKPETVTRKASKVAEEIKKGGDELKAATAKKAGRRIA